MPQPITSPGGAYRAFPKHVLERPKLAALLGAIAAQWGFVDRSLLDIFERATSKSFHRDEVATTIFDTLGAQGPKLDLIERMIELRLPDETKKKWKAIRKMIRDRSGERNPLIHGAWNISDAHPHELILLKVSGQAILYTERDFVEILDRVVELSNSVNDFVIEVANAKKTDP